MEIEIHPIVVSPSGDEYHVQHLKVFRTEVESLKDVDEEERISQLDNWYTDNLAVIFRGIYKDRFRVKNHELNKADLDPSLYKDETITKRVKALGFAPFIYRHDTSDDNVHQIFIKLDRDIQIEVYQEAMTKLLRQLN